MKILIIGASGFIGFNLYNFLSQKSGLKVVGTYFSKQKNNKLIRLDATSKKDLKKVISEMDYDVIIYAAGNKNLKICESDIEEAKKINTYPIIELLDILNTNNFNPQLIYISTDYVFDGLKGDYTTTDVPEPKTNYGISKYLSEIVIKKNYKNYSIVRTSAIMGKNGTFFDWIVGELKQKKTIELFNNIFFTPTPVKFLCIGLLDIIINKKGGIYHICGNLKFSRFSFGKFLKKLSDEFIATLKPVSFNGGDYFFQKDLSMVPSEGYVLDKQDLISFLKEEIGK